MPAELDRIFDIRRVELPLRLALRFCLGLTHRSAQVGMRWRSMTAPIIPLLLHQVRYLQGMAKSLVLHDRPLIDFKPQKHGCLRHPR
jgi:hypothetical protein